MDPDWRPSTPALDLASFRAAIRDQPVVAVHFWATWNGHDRLFDERLRPLREELSGRVTFGAMDVDEPAADRIASVARVTTLPALAFWVQRLLVRVVAGVRPTAEIRSLLLDAVAGRLSPVERRFPRLADSRAFESVLRGLGCRKVRSILYRDLVDSYCGPHRAYHTLEHLAEAFDVLIEIGDRVERWSEVECALWFHDAIYDTHRDDNEERSADWARVELLHAGAAPDVAARVHALVLATKHREPPEGNDARLLVDADLSILAAPPDRFAAYERQIRQEYDWVPEPQFREAREKFLRGMLARPSIFNDPAMRERHEAQARRNIEESLRRIGSSTR